MPQESPRGAIVAELRTLATNPDRVLVQLGDFAEWLAIGLCNMVNLVCPQLVVLGDLFTALPSVLREHVGQVVRERSLVSRALGGTRIMTSSLGSDAKLLGAAELAFEPVLATLGLEASRAVRETHPLTGTQ